MEGSVATKAAPPEPAPSHDGEAEATRSTEELFQWSRYVHVGAGALDCPGGEDGTCAEPTHFHAWLTMPNVFQNQDIVTKAQAAKARRRRAHRDPDSDISIVIDERLREAAEAPELLTALREIRARISVESEMIEIRQSILEDEDFEHIAADAEELRRLLALPEDARDTDEIARLEAHVDRFTEIVTERKEKRIASEIRRLTDMPLDEFMTDERKEAVEADCNQQYLDTMYSWIYYIAARKPVRNGYPTERRFARPDDLRATAPEVVAALRDTYRELELSFQRGDASGN